MGSIYHSLDNSELRTIVILQSYSDQYSRISKHNGTGYSINELSNMVGMNYRTTKKSLIVLADKNIIDISEKMIITLKYFNYDNVEREKGISVEKSQIVSASRGKARKTKNRMEALIDAGIQTTNKTNIVLKKIERKIDTIPSVGGKNG